MGKTATNLSIVLGLITIAFAGYYLYTQRSASILASSPSDQTMQNMLNNTKSFIEYRQLLDKIVLDTQFFEDPKFTSLRSFTTEIIEQPIGRPNPFSEIKTEGGGSI